jgi:hypothetical protein
MLADARYSGREPRMPERRATERRIRQAKFEVVKSLDSFTPSGRTVK